MEVLPIKKDSGIRLTIGINTINYGRIYIDTKDGDTYIILDNNIKKIGKVKIEKVKK